MGGGAGGVVEPAVFAAVAATPGAVPSLALVGVCGAGVLLPPQAAVMSKPQSNVFLFMLGA